MEALAEPVGDAVRTDRLIAPMAPLAAGDSLFLDIRDLAFGAHFAVTARHTPARQGGEAEESDQAHTVPPSILASGMPEWPRTER